MDKAIPRASALALAMMFLVHAANFLDRNILGMLLPQIRTEFHLSDAAMGFLAGPPFAVVYTLLGLPLAMLTDRGHRRRVVAWSLTVFSLMTALCAAAATFPQLLITRIGVGLGEAGIAPGLVALVADRFVPGRRAGAMSLISAGTNFGLLLSFFGGGLMAQHYGWRAAFLAAGAASALLILPFLAVVKETAIPSTAPRTGLLETARFLWTRRSFRFIALGCGLASISGYAGLAFVPSFLVRSHHLTPLQTGITLALFTGIFGFAGTALPGILSDRWGRGDPRWGIYAAALCIAVSLPFHALFYLATPLPLALVGLTGSAFFASSFLGPSLAAVQNLAETRMRAQAAALLLAVLNLIGLGLGPLFAGLVSDLLRHIAGEDSLRYALLSNLLPSALAALCFWRATRDLPQELARA
jgi:predicted MFS family arabinose efflux permease